MGVDRVRVGQVCLRTPDKAALTRLWPEMEDALRTASWPQGSGPQGGVIQIRKLDLGVIRPGTSRQELARRLGAELATQSPTRVRADRPIPDSPALHWPDRVELLAATAAMLARHHPLPWWAERALAGSSGPPEARYASVAAQLATTSGAEALAQLTLHLLALRDTATALHSLSPLLVQAAQRRFPSAMSALTQPPQPPAQNPAPPPQPQTTRFDPSPPPPAPTLTLARFVASLPPQARASIPPLLAHASLPPATAAACILLSLSSSFGPAAVTQLLRTATERAANPGAPPAPRPVPPQSPPASPPWPRAATPDLIRQPPAQPHPSPEPSRLPLPEGRSHLGGLPMLINLWRITGIPACEEALQTALCLPLTTAFLTRAAKGLDEADPLLSALPQALPDLHPVATTRTALPQAWALALAGQRLDLARITGRPGQRAVLFPGRRLCLGLIFARDIKALRRSHRLGIAPPLSQAKVLPALHQGLQILAARCLRHLTGQPWRQVIRRDAYLAATMTHIDITLDLDGVRIAERRAGLDISPHWVPWLARVVTLHFEPFQKPALARRSEGSHGW